MEIRKIYEPIDARPLESGAVQKLYKFANGYGASVVKGEHTYGGDEGLWELAVIRFNLTTETMRWTIQRRSRKTWRVT